MSSILPLFCQLFLQDLSRLWTEKMAKAGWQWDMWPSDSFRPCVNLYQIGAHCGANRRSCGQATGQGFVGLLLLCFLSFRAQVAGVPESLCFPALLYGCERFSGQILLRREGMVKGVFVLFFVLFCFFFFLAPGLRGTWAEQSQSL